MEKVLEIENGVSMNLVKKAYPAKKVPVRPKRTTETIISEDGTVEINTLTIELPVNDEVAKLFRNGTSISKTLQDFREVEKPELRKGISVVKMIIEDNEDVDLIIEVRTEVQERKNKSFEIRTEVQNKQNND